MTPHLNCLIEMVQMRGHNISFYAELTNIIPIYHQILPLILSSVLVNENSEDTDRCAKPRSLVRIIIVLNTVSLIQPASAYEILAS